jgi:voltage-gated potassium channel
MEYYIDAFSWAFTTITTVGYGDFYAVSDSEKIYAMFAMIVACGVKFIL